MVISILLRFSSFLFCTNSDCLQSGYFKAKQSITDIHIKKVIETKATKSTKNIVLQKVKINVRLAQVQHHDPYYEF